MKKVTHYFVYVGHSTQTKNKLQKDLKDYLHSLSGRLVKTENFEALKNEIIEKANSLSLENNRCTPIKILFSDLHTKNGVMINGFYIVTFQILEAYGDD